jgi:hypothetical protein
MTEDSRPMGSTEYENLTRDLVQRISDLSPLATTRLEHNVILPGRASQHQIDVLWEFATPTGAAQRIIFECKHRTGSLEQNDMLAFKSVVEEVACDSIPTTGVMVHLTGYQRGAKNIADTYGVIILELRSPDEDDLKGRLATFEVLVVQRWPVARNWRFDLRELLSDALGGPVLDEAVEVEDAIGHRQKVKDLLLRGEIIPGSELTPLHRVTRDFDPPALVLVDGQPAGRATSISATVGEEQADPLAFTIDGRKRLAWMVKATLGGARAWFATDGQVYLIK